MLSGLSDVETLQVQGESGGRERPAETTEQGVVSPAAADCVTDGRVVYLQDRPRVVAEVAEQTEVDLDPIGDPRGLEPLESLSEPGGGPFDRGSADGSCLLEHLGAATDIPERDDGGSLGISEIGQIAGLSLDRNQVVRRETLEDAVARPTLDLELVQHLSEEVSIAEADNGATEPDRVERGDEHLDQLDGPLRGFRADELDPDLAELSKLPALWSHAPVDAPRVGQPKRSLLRGEARGDHAGDRHRHVVAEREHRPGLVEEAIGRGSLGALALGDHLLVLDRRGGHLLVAAPVEEIEQR